MGCKTFLDSVNITVSVFLCCSPFDAVDTGRQYSHVQQSAYTDQTSAPLYANDAIANSGALYEEISTNHGAGTMRVMVRALYDYQAVEDDELSLTAGKFAGHVCIVYSNCAYQCSVSD